MSSKQLIGSYEIKLRRKEDLLLIYDVLLDVAVMTDRLISFQIAVISRNRVEISLYKKNF